VSPSDRPIEIRDLAAHHHPDPAPGPILINVSGASVSYGNRQILCDVDWTIRHGEQWALLGPNGSGKTTLLSLLVGDHPQAYANDISYEDIFVEPMKNFFRPDDLVIGISGSGNSKNVLKAIEYANKNEGRTVGLCGYEGGKLHDMVDIPLLARVNDMQKVEDVHMIVVHISMQAISKKLGQYQPAC